MNIQEFMSKLNQFKQAYTGNPQQQIQQMLNSGKVTQQQYNNAVQMANNIMRMMGGKF